MGTFAVATTYLLGRELFGRKVAWIAAALLAVNRTAIDFSRVGVCHIQVVFFEALAFYFWWRALRTGRALHYLWAGIGLGLCMYSYNAGQLVPPLLFAWMAMAAVSDPSRIRTYGPGAAISLAAFVLTLFPYLYFFTDGFTFGERWEKWTIMARSRQVWSEVAAAYHQNGAEAAGHILRRQAWRTWLGFGVLPGENYALGYRRGGTLDDVSAASFVLGIFVALRRLRNPRYGFVLYWFVVTMIGGGIFTIAPPAVVRMVGLLPAVALLAALPLVHLIESTRRSAAMRVMSVAVVSVVLTWITWENWRTYFREMPSEAADPISELGRHVASLPNDISIEQVGAEHFLNFTKQELFWFQFPGRGRDVPDPPHFFPIHHPVQGPVAIVLGPTQATLLEYIRSLYPGLRHGEVVSQHERKLLFRTLLLQAEEIKARTGLSVVSAVGGVGWAAKQITDPFAPSGNLILEGAQLNWRGSLYWPAHHPATLKIEATGVSSIQIADVVVLQNDAASFVTRTLDLPRGWHPVVIEETVRASRRLSMAIEEPQRRRQLSRWDFRPDLTTEGLNATYELQPRAVLKVIDPQINAFAWEDRFEAPNLPMVRMPFRATWRGGLRVDKPGVYEIEAVGSGPYSLEIGGSSLLRAANVIPEEPVIQRRQVLLETGVHPILAHFDSTRAAHTTRRIFQLYWTPPEGQKQLIPPPHFVREAPGFESVDSP